MPFGISELLLTILVILLLFGAKNIPEISRNLGRSLGAFKKGIKDSEEDREKNDSADDKISDDK